MIYFDFLKIYKKIEDLRLKNAKLISNLLQKTTNNFLENTQKSLSKPFNILLISIGIIVFGIVIRSFSPFDHFQILSSDSFILPNQQKIMLGELMNNSIVKIIEKFELNNFVIAELVLFFLGIVTCWTSYKLLKKSIFSFDRVGLNLIILSEVFIYFIAFNFSDNAMFNFNKHYLISLFIIYYSLIATNNSDKKISYDFLIAIISALLILLKMQNIFLVIFGEIFLFFLRKRPKNTGYFLIRLMIFLAIIAIYWTMIIKGSIYNVFLFDFTNWHFFLHKFFDHKIINEIYLNQHSRGFFWMLSQEIFLVFLMLFCYRQILNSKIIFSNQVNKTSQQILLNFFWIIFLASLIMSLCANRIDYNEKEIFCLLNFPAVIYIFFNILFTKRIDFKRHGIALAIIAVIGFGDSKIFFEIFFYFPYIWFVFFIIFSTKLKHKILKNNLSSKLNDLEKFFVLYSKKTIFLFVVIVTIFLIMEFIINFLLAWLIALILLCLMIVNYHRINQKLFSVKKNHFLISVIFIVNFVYFFNFVLANFRIYGDKNFYFFAKERQDIKSILINEINYLGNKNNQTLIISSPHNSFQDISTFIKNKITNHVEIPYFSSVNLANKNEYYEIGNNLEKFINIANNVIAIDNSTIIGKYFCAISNFEQMMRFGYFKKLLNDNYFFYKRIKIFYSFKDDLNFYDNTELSIIASTQFIIYDYEIFLRK